jgi:predicted phosphodiesterase
LTWSQGDLSVVHAAPANPWRAPTAEASDAELMDTYGLLGTRFAVYGHIHNPHIRRLRSFTVANAGAVSLSYDGDTRAAYLVVDDRKSVDQVLALLQVLNCDVDLVVRTKSA